VSDVDKVFFALSDPTRREVMRRISDQSEMTPTELAATLPVTRQAVTKHLGVLLDAGLVAQERRGRESVYRLTPQPMGGALSWMADVGAEWDERLSRLRKMFVGAGGPRGRHRDGPSRRPR
jgi:DNA-binding transcriptional ArsR family regulator